MSLIYSMLMSVDGYEVMGSAMNRWSPYVLSILRIITAFLYMVHGTQKLENGEGVVVWRTDR